MFSRKRKVEDEIDDGPPFRGSMSVGCGYLMPCLSKWEREPCKYCAEMHTSDEYNSRSCKNPMKVTIRMEDNSSFMLEEEENIRQIASRKGALKYHEAERRKKHDLNLQLDMAKKQYQDVLMAHQSEMDGEHQK